MTTPESAPTPRLLHSLRLKFQIWRWPKCACGQMKVAEGSRTEIRGVSHGRTPCFHCDTYGNPA